MTAKDSIALAADLPLPEAIALYDEIKAYVGVDEGITKQVVLDTAQIAKPMPYVARFDEMDKEISAGLDSVYGGQRPARDAMTEVVRKVNAILAGILILANVSESSGWVLGTLCGISFLFTGAATSLAGLGLRELRW